MKTTYRKTTTLAELKLQSMKCDTAKAVPMFACAAKIEQTQLYGIWNEQQDRLCTVASNNYNIVQHTDFIKDAASAMHKLNLKCVSTIRDSGNKVIVNINFTNSKLFVKKGGEFYLGVRLINSYNRTTGVLIQPHLVRIVCTNGMVLGRWLKGFSIRHNSNMVGDIEHATKKVISDMAKNNDRFKALIESCIIDSVEWAVLDKILPSLMETKKHWKVIQQKLKEQNLKKISRWDLYNAVTDYVSHNKSLSAVVDEWLQNKAQRILVTPFENLIAI